MHHYIGQPRVVYRFPCIWWSRQYQQWVVSRRDIASSRVIIEHQEIDVSQLPLPLYFPGQQVIFRDSKNHRHQGVITQVGTYGCDYQDPSERDYWYQWSYLSRMAIMYFVQAVIPVTSTVSTTGSFQLFADAIITVLPPFL